MLSSLELRRFRGFDSLAVEGLTRVNLFVGANNTGKTSVLEGTEILLAGGLVRTLWRIPSRRGEDLLPQIEERAAPARGFASRPGPDIDICHLFHGHSLRQGSGFSIHGKNTEQKHVSCQIVVSAPNIDADQTSLPLEEGTESELPLVLSITSDRFSGPLVVPLSSAGGIPWEVRRRYPAGLDGETTKPVNFIGTADPDTDRVNALWDNIVLSPQEPKVTAALQLIEPGVERLAALSQAVRKSSGGGGFFVKLAGNDQRIPIGSMGDGIKRLLVLTLNLVNSAGGYLLVDEIDTGLHYSTMSKMWKLVIETAKQLDVQILATTHSLDCVRALAWLYHTSPNIQGQVTLHRIERGGDSSIVYSAAEISAAAQQHMELR